MASSVNEVQIEQTQLFETERVLVRQLTVNDAKAMYSVYGDAEAMRWVGDGEPLDLAGCHQWVQVTHHNYARRGYGMSALVLRETSVVFGFCGIVHPGGQETPEIKYALQSAYWGRGLATEVVKGMLVYGAHTFQLHEIIATTAPENFASQQVLRKAGLVFAYDRHEEDGSIIKVFVWRHGTS